MENSALMLAFMMNKTPMELFKVGGPVMWPMLFLSLTALTVVIERLIFAVREKRCRRSQEVRKLLSQVEANDLPGAIKTGKESSDFVARILGEALEHKEGSMADAFMHASSQQLVRYQQGLPVLDTAITAAPLLGLLGTVTGMMNSFGQISGELGAPTAITGGIAEALVATACGLFIAVTSLIPYNYLNTMLENARREVEEAGNALEVVLRRIGRDVDITSGGAEVPAKAKTVPAPAH